MKENGESIGLTGWLKENTVALIGWVLCIGITYGSYTITAKWTEERIKRLEDANPTQLRWQVDQDQARIKEIDAESKITQAQISDIKAQIGVINNKLDTIIETLKKPHN
jgi:peptidoglycan hydrolase CwlO-like protein